MERRAMLNDTDRWPIKCLRCAHVAEIEIACGRRMTEFTCRQCGHKFVFDSREFARAIDRLKAHVNVVRANEQTYLRDEPEFPRG